MFRHCCETSHQLEFSEIFLSTHSCKQTLKTMAQVLHFTKGDLSNMNKSKQPGYIYNPAYINTTKANTQPKSFKSKILTSWS